MALLDFARRGPVRLIRRWQGELGDHVMALAWSPDGKTLAAASVSGPIALFSTNTGQVLHKLPGHGFGTASLSWRGDGKVLASAGQDGKVRLWEGSTEICALAGGSAWVEHVLWHPGDDVLASAAGKKLRLWSGAGQELRAYPDQPSTIADLAWRPGSAELASAAYGGVTLWHPGRDEPTRRLEWKGSVLKLAWSPRGDLLAHGNQDATVHFWNLKTGQDLQMAGYPIKVRELSWDPTGRYLATGGGEAVTVWDCKPPGPENSTPLSFADHEATVSALAYQAGGPLLASGGQDGRVFLYQPGKFKKSQARSELDGPIAGLAWSRDDRLLAVGTETGTVVLYSVG